MRGKGKGLPRLGIEMELIPIGSASAPYTQIHFNWAIAGCWLARLGWNGALQRNQKEELTPYHWSVLEEMKGLGFVFSRTYKYCGNRYSWLYLDIWLVLDIPIFEGSRFNRNWKRVDMNALVSECLEPPKRSHHYHVADLIWYQFSICPVCARHPYACTMWSWWYFF